VVSLEADGAESQPVVFEIPRCDIPRINLFVVGSSMLPYWFRRSSAGDDRRLTRKATIDFRELALSTTGIVLAIAIARNKSGSPQRTSMKRTRIP
jgi:hypothetical protein